MRKQKLFPLFFLVALVAVLLIYCHRQSLSPNYETATIAQKKILDYAQANHLSYTDYPQSLIDLLDRNPETEKFVLEYPTASKQTVSVNLSDFGDFETVPHFLQWDQRWGYLKYGKDVVGLTGCGPVCLSMAACFVTKDISFSPDKIIQFAIDNSYYVSGSGSSWTLISEGTEKLGLKSTELPLVKNRIIKELEAGNPVICVMGPGDFTTTGHFIVLTEYRDGNFLLKDSNSIANTKKAWSYEQLEGQIRNLWSISA